MGINVLQGLVKVERGEEAERSGLQGPRPLSVSAQIDKTFAELVEQK